MHTILVHVKTGAKIVKYNYELLNTIKYNYEFLELRNE